MSLTSTLITLRILEQRDDEGGRFDRTFELRRDADLRFVYTVPEPRMHLMVGRDILPLVKLVRKAKYHTPGLPRFDVSSFAPRIGETAVTWMHRCFDVFDAWLGSAREAVPVAALPSSLPRPRQTGGVAS